MKNSITITVNGRTQTIHTGMRARDVKELLGIDPGRVLLARRPDGRLELVAEHKPIPSAELLDVPRFIYG